MYPALPTYTIPMPTEQALPTRANIISILFYILGYIYMYIR